MYTAVAPALAVSESLAASFPATAAFQPRNLQTIFSPSKQDVDLASIQQQFDDLKKATDEMIVELEQQIVGHEQKIVGHEQKIVVLEQDIVELKQNIVELKQNIVELKQNIVELKQENDQLKEDSRRHQSRIANLEEVVEGYKAISQSCG